MYPAKNVFIALQDGVAQSSSPPIKEQKIPGSNPDRIYESYLGKTWLSYCVRTYNVLTS
jgi:hypothetical protein